MQASRKIELTRPSLHSSQLGDPARVDANPEGQVWQASAAIPLKLPRGHGSSFDAPCTQKLPAAQLLHDSMPCVGFHLPASHFLHCPPENGSAFFANSLPGRQF